MSNHSGSYMLSEVLYLLKIMGLTEKMDTKEKRELARKVMKIGESYDCNNGEILDEIGAEYGICESCYKDSDSFKGGYCHACNQKYC